MTVAFAVFLVLHGLIHLLGFAKAFGLAELPQLTRPVSATLGIMWLLAACLFVVATIALYVWPRWWWMVGACAIALSMALVVSSWEDARAGAFANAIALAGVLFGFLTFGPSSLRAQYDRDVERGLARFTPAAPVTEADLAHLPGPVQRYLRVTGVVGQPRVRNFRVRMHGRIRSGPHARWMPLTTEQYNFVDEPARLFYMRASMMTIPVQGYHRYVGSEATMLVKAAALVPVARASGSEMNRAETVTMFNDMCMMAPATLVDPAITWEDIDPHTVRARFTNGGHTIQAELSFNDAGELTNFVSDDRYLASADGSVRNLRWSTPLRAYRSFGAIRLASGGEARWHEPAGEYAYIELTFDEIKYNVAGSNQ